MIFLTLLTVSLMVIQIKCCLDEWRTGVLKNCSFTATQYRSTYQAILGLIDQVECDRYHAAKFLEIRKRWARRGRVEAGSDETPGHEHVGFRVHLD